MRFIQFKKIIFLLGLCFFFPLSVKAAENNYPRLANYYLSHVPENVYEKLARWDLLVVPAETAFSCTNFFDYYRSQNPNGQIFSYVYPAMVNVGGLNDSVGLSRYMYENVRENDWWLRGEKGQKLEFWPDVYALDITDYGFREFNINYVKEKIKLDLWDGIFFDIVDDDISHYNSNGGIDINKDGEAESRETFNREWREGMDKLLERTREELGNKKKILINGVCLNDLQPPINGRMFETFPTPWEGDGSWEDVMEKYLQTLPRLNQKPLIYIINSNTNNTGDYNNYRKMRFGLTSTLLGNGYFSFDHGDESHAQLWWYDEYDQDLGSPRGEPYNLLDKENNIIEKGLWRRNFEKGVSLVNSTNQEQTYYFRKEIFQKINGTQDRRVNDGARVNWVELQPKDGIILLKENREIRNNSFRNGSFVRVFNERGRQTQGGFFSYQDAYPGNSEILISDIDNITEDNEILVNGGGKIKVFKKGEEITSFNPYAEKFRGSVSFAVADLNGDKTKEIITGAGEGGGPHVRIFSTKGRPLIGGFFAYPRQFRGGVEVAVMDLNNDGYKEIITGAGPGGGPQVRVFSKEGWPLTGGFFAFEKDSRSGVSIAVGNIDGKGDKEIIVSSRAPNNPVVKIFSKDGEFIKKFRAYEGDLDYGIRVMAYDLNRDGKEEILASTISY